MFIDTKLYGVCKVLKIISPRYYELKATEKSLFYNQGQKFRIYLMDSEFKPITYKEIYLF